MIMIMIMLHFVHVVMSGDSALTHSMLGKDQSVKIIIFIDSIIFPFKILTGNSFFVPFYIELFLNYIKFLSSDITKLYSFEKRK